MCYEKQKNCLQASNALYNKYCSKNLNCIESEVNKILPQILDSTVICDYTANSISLKIHLEIH